MRIVFDRYDIKSIKGNTRSGRTKGIDPVHYQVTDSTRIKHLDTKRFLASTETKNELTVYLANKLTCSLENDYVVVEDRTCYTNILDLDISLKSYGNEEADTGMVLHAIDTCRRDKYSGLTVSCSDTDVLLILLHYFEEIPSTTVFKTTEHCYVLKKIVEKLTYKMQKALLGFHAFSGCDQTGEFHGFTKNSCWDVFENSSNEIFDAFGNLGTTNLTPNIDYPSLESFVMSLYCKQKVPTDASSLADLRWFLFSKKQSESYQMPPTYGTLKEKIKRAHFTALQWNSSHVPDPSLPDPEEYGWKWNDGIQLYDAVMTTLPPAPENIIELTMCNCKTGYKTNRCKCRKISNLKCTELCKCDSCENTDSDLINIDDHEIDENYDI